MSEQGDIFRPSSYGGKEVLCIEPGGHGWRRILGWTGDEQFSGIVREVGPGKPIPATFDGEAVTYSCGSLQPIIYADWRAKGNS